jgi:hypothetical protein
MKTITVVMINCYESIVEEPIHYKTKSSIGNIVRRNISANLLTVLWLLFERQDLISKLEDEISSIGRDRFDR